MQTEIHSNGKCLIYILNIGKAKKSFSGKTERNFLFPLFYNIYKKLRIFRASVQLGKFTHFIGKL